MNIEHFIRWTITMPTLWLDRYLSNIPILPREIVAHLKSTNSCDWSKWEDNVAHMTALRLIAFHLLRQQSFSLRELFPTARGTRLILNKSFSSMKSVTNQASPIQFHTQAGCWERLFRSWGCLEKHRLCSGSRPLDCFKERKRRQSHATVHSMQTLGIW
jgi:hypothetical protein